MTTKPLHVLVQEARARLGQEGGGQPVSASDLRQKLMEAVETRQILSALKELEGKPQEEQVNILEKLGINFGVVTEAAKAATETYRSLFQDEREARREAARAAEAEKERADMAQLEVLKMLVQGLSETQKQVHEQQAKLLEEVKNLFNRTNAGPGDPFSDALKQVMGDLVKVTLGRAMHGGDGGDPFQQLRNTIELLDLVEKRAEERASKRASAAPATVSPRDWLELKRIESEIELEKIRWQKEIDILEKRAQQQAERGKEFMEVLRDALVAFMERMGGPGGHVGVPDLGPGGQVPQG